MTSLSTLQSKLHTLPKDAKGYIVVNVGEFEDIKGRYTIPKNMQLVVNTNLSLAEQVKLLQWLDGVVAVWCACEFNMMRQIRAYVNYDRDVSPKRCYFSSYWKYGVTEDGHKVIKRKDLADFTA